MNKARKESAKKLVSKGFDPKEAYELVRATGDQYAHAVWVKGTLVRKDKVAGGSK